MSFFLFFPFVSPFFIFYSFIFLLFSFKKKVSSFFILFLFFLFSGAQNLWRHSRIPWAKSAHSELALFALYWLIVTFPFGIVHILVMIRLRVVFGGRRVGQVFPSYQNRQISALDETADALSLVSSLFSFLTSLYTQKRN